MYKDFDRDLFIAILIVIITVMNFKLEAVSMLQDTHNKAISTLIANSELHTKVDEATVVAVQKLVVSINKNTMQLNKGK